MIYSDNIITGISVIVPCYNCEATLDRCINSIFSQTISYIEIILVDDGSTDKTGEMCNFYAAIDKRVKVIHKENGGLMSAWQCGVKNSNSDYVAFVDSDDWVEANMLEKMVGALIEHRVDIVQAGIMYDYPYGKSIADSNTKLKGAYIKEEYKYVYNHVFGIDTLQSPAVGTSRCSKLIKKDLLLRNLKYLPLDVSIGEDDLTTFAIINDAKGIYFFEDFYPYHYVRSADSMLGKSPSNMLSSYHRIIFELKKIATAKGYENDRQINWHFLWLILMGLKKQAQDLSFSHTDMFCIFKDECESEDFREALRSCKEQIKKFKVHEKIYIGLLNLHLYGVTVLLLRLMLRDNFSNL